MTTIITMHDYEKLGQFYLGRHLDPGREEPGGDLLLYDSRDLVTHAVCVGMTGSGKTGPCLALLEEAAIDGVPALIIDLRLLPTSGKPAIEVTAPDPAEAGQGIWRWHRAGNAEFRRSRLQGSGQYGHVVPWPPADRT